MITVEQVMALPPSERKPGTVIYNKHGVRGIILTRKSYNNRTVAEFECAIFGCLERHVREVNEWYHTKYCRKHGSKDVHITNEDILMPKQGDEFLDKVNDRIKNLMNELMTKKGK